MAPNICQTEVEEGRGAPMPDYVGEIQLARYIGVPVDELDGWPAHRIEQYAIVRAAEIKAQNARADAQG